LVERKRIGVLTTGRQDYGILRSTLLTLRDDARFELRLFVGGMHLSEAYGHTVDRIEADRLHIDAEVHTLGERPDMAAESARALERMTGVLTGSRPDALLLVGDRYETLAAAFAATLVRIPIAHLHGGEESEGAIDNAFRHAITKLSHLHLVSHAVHARRVLQMGETPDSVVVVGAPGLDNLHRRDLPGPAALEDRLGIALEPPVVAVTLHPATLGKEPAAEARAVADAMARVPATYVISQPNSDAGGDVIRAFWAAWVVGRERVALVDALGETLYWTLLRTADAVLGNSSSGIIEAPAVGLPVLNVGDRQRGRLRSPHVLDVAADAAVIELALRRVLAPGAREHFAEVESPFLIGPAAPRIAQALAEWRIPDPPRKPFQDLPGIPG
jgi:UDP-hydrolysing UDP-N-acetyl-D-glucosamine 2-epimerase